MAALIGAIAGAAVGLIYTAAKDLLESDGPDPQKIQQVKDAIAAREQELIGQGVDAMEANLTAGDEFKQALAEASQTTDGTTFGDYIGNVVTGAGIGAGAAMIPAVGRGLTAGASKLKSFLPAGKEVAAASDDVYRAGFNSPAREAAGRGSMDAVRGSNLPTGTPRLGGPSSGPGLPPPRREVMAEVVPKAGPGPGIARGPQTIDVTAERMNPGIGMVDDATLNPAIDDIIDAAMAPLAKRIGYSYAGRVPMPVIDPRQGAMNIPSFLR